MSLLRGIPLFDGLAQEELERISRLIDHIEVEPGEVLMREGQRGAESFIVAEGTAEVIVGGRRLALLEPGGFFGEMSLLDFQPRSATVRAITPMHLLVLGPAQFMDLLQQPGVAVRVLKGVVHRLRQTYAHVGAGAG